MAKREAEDGAADALVEASSIPMDIGSGMGKGNKANPLGNSSNQPNLADLQKEMESMKIGGNIGGGPPAGIQKMNTMQPPMADPMGNQMFGGSIAEPTI
jgi:hypothetical protein